MMAGICKECGNVLPSHRAACSIGQASNYIARYWYDRTRGARAFTIPKHSKEEPRGYVAKRGNAAAYWYDFADGSRLKVGRCNKGERGQNAIQCGPWPDVMHAIRTLWES